MTGLWESLAEEQHAVEEINKVLTTKHELEQLLVNEKLAERIINNMKPTPFRYD